MGWQWVQKDPTTRPWGSYHPLKRVFIGFLGQKTGFTLGGGCHFESPSKNPAGILPRFFPFFQFPLEKLPRESLFWSKTQYLLKKRVFSLEIGRSEAFSIENAEQCRFPHRKCRAMPVFSQRMPSNAGFRIENAAQCRFSHRECRAMLLEPRESGSFQHFFQLFLRFWPISDRFGQ